LFTLVSFGGAGGLHVCELASALRIPQVFIPRSPGTLSALGVLLGDVVKDYSRTVMMKMSGLNLRATKRIFAELEREARRDLLREGFSKERVRLARSAAMRYAGQSFEIDVKWSKKFEADFHAAHRQRYGYADRSRPTEIVSLRVRASGITEKPRLRRAASAKSREAKASHTASVYFSERPTRTPVYQRDDIPASVKLRGPAIIAEYSSTTLVPAGRSVEVDDWLNLIVV
jgi:N-methylhydantoinase A